MTDTRIQHVLKETDIVMENDRYFYHSKGVLYSEDIEPENVGKMASGVSNCNLQTDYIVRYDAAPDWQQDCEDARTGNLPLSPAVQALVGASEWLESAIIACAGPETVFRMADRVVDALDAVREEGKHG
jgi:hypothetical protein